jgi:osmotically-inducible protein OsmY
MKKKSLLFGILGAAAIASIMRCSCKQKVSGEAAEYAEDSMITAKIKAKLAADDIFKALDVRV